MTVSDVSFRLSPDIARVRRKANQQPSRDAKVLPDRKSRHVGAGPDKPAQQKSHRNFPSPALMSFRTGVFYSESRCCEQNHQATMNQSTTCCLSTRQRNSGENHHLWNNHGTWWFHGTEHRPDGTAYRIRISLRTRDSEEARRRRDKILSLHGNRQSRNLRVSHMRNRKSENPTPAPAVKVMDVIRENKIIP